LLPESTARICNTSVGVKSYNSTSSSSAPLPLSLTSSRDSLNYSVFKSLQRYCPQAQCDFALHLIDCVLSDLDLSWTHRLLAPHHYHWVITFWGHTPHTSVVLVCLFIITATPLTLLGRLSWLAKTQLNHWAKRVVSTQLAAKLSWPAADLI